MILHLFATKDIKVGAFNQPFAVRASGQAIRGFLDAMRSPEATHPADMELWKLGTFNDDNGQLTQELTFICNGQQDQPKGA